MTLEEREKKRKSFVQTMVDKKQQQTEDKYIQRSYYLKEDLLKAITIKTAECSLDKSGVVREALEIYLADILERIRK